MTREIKKKELKIYKELLLKERAEILKGVRNITEDNLKKTQRDSTGDLSGYSFHIADMATDNYDREFLLEIAEGERETLARIDEALKRIEERSYGKCLLCGKMVSTRRLKAVPYAENCKKCQEKEESERRR